jgi:hypothetical protein
MMDVGVWLHGLGLGQYEAAFREHEIDGDVLPNLTADDLNELGITIVGHRRKLLTAIASLNQSLPASAIWGEGRLYRPPRRRSISPAHCIRESVLRARKSLQACPISTQAIASRVVAERGHQT